MTDDRVKKATDDVKAMPVEKSEPAPSVTDTGYGTFDSGKQVLRSELVNEVGKLSFVVLVCLGFESPVF